MHTLRHERYFEFGIGIHLQQVSHVLHLAHNHRHKHITQYPEKESRLKKRDKDGNHPPLQPEQTAVKLHKRLKQIGDKASHTERQ